MDNKNKQMNTLSLSPRPSHEPHIHKFTYQHLWMLIIKAAIANCFSTIYLVFQLFMHRVPLKSRSQFPEATLRDNVAVHRWISFVLLWNRAPLEYKTVLKNKACKFVGILKIVINCIDANLYSMLSQIKNENRVKKKQYVGTNFTIKTG